MRTYSSEHWNAALDAWDAGEFSREWRDVRHQAAMRGIIYPPDGSKWDSWEDDSPSQRAMLIRAIRETPALLSKCIARSQSWSDVIAKLTQARDDWRAEIALAESRIVRDEPDHRESTLALGSIIRRIGDSA